MFQPIPHPELESDQLHDIDNQGIAQNLIFSAATTLAPAAITFAATGSLKKAAVAGGIGFAAGLVANLVSILATDGEGIAQVIAEMGKNSR
ncbi:MAG: hypothetical protein LBL46_04285 [Rickettsiales bacterium]|jgi:hypothetical protein|nr:hypothetical protein [Rickettsiales bacterium]